MPSKATILNLKRDHEDLKDMRVRDLLTVDVEKYIQQAEVLSEDYTSNSEIIHEIMETEEKEELQEALDAAIDVDIRAFNKLLRGFTPLESLKDTYSETVSMKALVTHLQEMETLIGPASQEEIKSLRDYLVRVEPILLGLACTEMQDLYKHRVSL